MAFDPTKIAPNQIAAARDQYDTLTKGRGLGSGISNDGTYTDPFDKGHDGSYSVNPWTHADNQNPWRGNVTLKDHNGKNQTVAGWQADRQFSANLGLTGFQDITNQLNQLQANFSKQLGKTSDQGWANLAAQTGTKFVSRKGNKFRA